jgi:broad specificity phosphatase PhoE
MLVRHGEGRANVDRAIAGLSGCGGLTELGRRRVHALNARWAQTGFRPDVLVSSPVRRARETAEILAASAPGLGNRNLARRSLAFVDFDRLNIAQGVCIEKDAKPLVERSFRWLATPATAHHSAG